MADNAEQLVQMITQHVLAALASSVPADDCACKGSEGACACDAPAASTNAPASIHPPIGVCTGDYSKFEELKGRAVGATRAGTRPTAAPAPSTATTAPSAPTPAPPAPAAMSGFITARMLEKVRDGVVHLAPNARLTPLARDYAKERGFTVIHADAQNKQKVSPAARAAQWHWWIDGHCPVVDQVTTQFRTEMRPVTTQRNAGELSRVITQVARQVRDGRSKGATLFVHSAAQAACFANRCPSLRAIVGTCGQAVEEGVRTLGANVLIVEYPHHGRAAVQEMVRTFMSMSRPTTPVVDRQLRELTSCV